MLSTKGSRYDLKRQAKRTGIPLIKDEMRGNLLDYVFRSQDVYKRQVHQLLVEAEAPVGNQKGDRQARSKAFRISP